MDNDTFADGQTDEPGLWPPGWAAPHPLDAWCWGFIDVALAHNPITLTVGLSQRGERLLRIVCNVDIFCDPVDGLFSIKLHAPPDMAPATFREHLRRLRAKVLRDLFADGAAGLALALDIDQFDEGADAVAWGPTRVVFDMLDATVILTPRKL